MPRDVTSLFVDRDLDRDDHTALAAVSRHGGALCTIVGIEGSFSRRLGAQLAVLPDGSFAGSLSDGCLEAQLRRDCREAKAPHVRRYGRGSAHIDFRLPCGGGLDILIDPAPDREACAAALRELQHRRQCALALPANDHMAMRGYIPGLVIRILGEEPEVGTMQRIGEAAGIACELVPISALSLGRPSGLPPADRWTAVVALFHDHEWEASLIEEALASDAFYIGAQGGLKARAARIEELARRGVGLEALARLRSPIGTPTGSRSPQTLALSVLAEIAGEYELLRSQP
jgi:xanthine dehydrogenase accessory factor